MRRKTFILGAGGQKCGSSWVHQYLERSPNADLGCLKEYHVWDALTIPQCKAFRLAAPLTDASETRHLRLRMQTDLEDYFDYFHSLVSKDGIDVTGDHTPSYAGLDRSVFKQISDGFTSRSVDCKAVFLMRDPVDRCLSALAMHVERGDVGFKLDDEHAVRKNLCAPGYAMRTRYDLTLGELDVAFPGDRVFLAIYEEMFSDSSIARLSEFAGVPCRPERRNRRVNRARRHFEFSETLRGALARNYSPVYAYMAQRFPQTRDLWAGFKYL